MTSWWTPYINAPNNLNRLPRQKLEEIFTRSVEHMKQLNDQEANLYSSMRDLSQRSSSNVKGMNSTPGQGQQSSIIITSDRRVNQLVKTVNSLNGDKLQLQKEIKFLQEMLMKLNANVNRDKFKPEDLLYTYTFDNNQMKMICSYLIDLNNATQDEADHEDYLFILDLFTSSALRLLPRRLDKTRPAYEQRLVDYEDDIACLTSERNLAKKKVQDLAEHINNIPKPDIASISQNDIQKLLDQIDQLGDTKSRLETAKLDLEDILDQKRALSNQKVPDFFDVDDVTMFSPESEVHSLKAKNQDLLNTKDALYRANGELLRKLQGSDEGKSDMTGSSEISLDNAEALSKRLEKIGATPDQLQQLWSWSQSARIDDLMADIEGLHEHKKLLINRKESLQRKTEQLVALLQNYDDHIEKLNAVIQESQKAENE